jgi:hypothetical protein
VLQINTRFTYKLKAGDRRFGKKVQPEVDQFLDTDFPTPHLSDSPLTFLIEFPTWHSKFSVGLVHNMETLAIA